MRWETIRSLSGARCVRGGVRGLYTPVLGAAGFGGPKRFTFSGVFGMTKRGGVRGRVLEKSWKNTRGSYKVWCGSCDKEKKWAKNEWCNWYATCASCCSKIRHHCRLGLASTLRPISSTPLKTENLRRVS